MTDNVPVEQQDRTAEAPADVGELSPRSLHAQSLREITALRRGRYGGALSPVVVGREILAPPRILATAAALTLQAFQRGRKTRLEMLRHVLPGAEPTEDETYEKPADVLPGAEPTEDETYEKPADVEEDIWVCAKCTGYGSGPACWNADCDGQPPEVESTAEPDAADEATDVVEDIADMNARINADIADAHEKIALLEEEYEGLRQETNAQYRAVFRALRDVDLNLSSRQDKIEAAQTAIGLRQTEDRAQLELHAAMHMRSRETEEAQAQRLGEIERELAQFKAFVQRQPARPEAPRLVRTFWR